MGKSLRFKCSIFFIALFLICISTYFSSLSYDFIFDDIALVVDNPLIKDFNYIGKIFTTTLYDFSYDSSKPSYYRPLQLISVMLDYRVWKLNPFGYHLTNVCLHFLNAFLIFGLILLLFEDFFAAATSGVFFCVHPINTTAVTYISGRADLLVSLFMLAAFFCAVLSFKYKKGLKTNLVLVILFFILALLSRENALVMPLGILLLGFFTKGQREYKTYLLIIILFVLFLYLYIRFGILNIPLSTRTLVCMPPYFRLINFLYVIFCYIFLLIFPVNLYLMHVTKPILGVSDIRLLVMLALFLAFLAFWYFKRKDKVVSFSVIWFFIFILPVFPVMTNFAAKLTIAESWLYLAAAGFYIIISKIIISFKPYFKNIIYPLIFFIVLIYIALTVSNNANFKNRIVVSNRILQFDSDNKEARKELAGIYLKEKEYARAFEQIDKALKISASDEDLYLLQGMYYEDTGDINSAVSSYEKILKIAPNSARAYNNLGGIYLNNGNLDKAQGFFRQAAGINPLLYEPYMNLAKLKFKKKEIDSAAPFYEKVLSLNPHINEAALALAQIYKEKGLYASAIEILKKALDAGQPDASILVTLGMLASEKGWDDTAEYYFKEALRWAPKSDDVMLNMGVFYANNNRFDKAIEIWQEALKYNPDNEVIKENIEKAKQLLPGWK